MFVHIYMSNMNKLCLLIGEDIHIVLVGLLLLIVLLRILPMGRRCRDRMVVGFTTTYAISAYRIVNSNLGHGEMYNIM